ncbi:hypothetical protein D3871_17665 [Noviherbaspirillum saxi]|uniref:Integrase SAM-like N-terminal domain-containing protein n=2 Tax=Noviherbaspirillum saxi TaxID=2320863 RepID=A0A3A3FIE8_9BURK|nr:hypothetical protein D3871_17665 [Noviherbaspirillum saxi]
MYWARWYIRFHGLHHPVDMGAPKIHAFLSYLANERQVSISTHRREIKRAVLAAKLSKHASLHTHRRP